MCKGIECLDKETVEKITNGRFDEIGNTKECYEFFMGGSAARMVDIEVEMIKHKDKCRKLNKYTPEDLKTAIRFYNCLFCVQNSFM
jgi:hypothetical protein